jgi:hypothetical protein
MSSAAADMESHKLIVKLFVEDPSAIRADEFVPIFHSWIQMRLVAGHQLIDVADYKHVHDGPGTLLIAHEANFAMDRGQGRLGLMYARKQPLDGAFRQRLASVLRIALEAAVRLEEDVRLQGRLRFRGDELLLRINDRLLAPNVPQTFAALRPDIQTVLAELYDGADVSLEHDANPEHLFGVYAKASASPSAAELLRRLGGRT